jgi:polyferredoxin
MLHNIPEKTMHRVRWLLTCGWLLLIASLFYDPITIVWTQADNFASPFRIDPDRCIQIRDLCLPQEPYAMSALIWWAMIVPTGIFILLVLGHEFWRRICPLSFLSQIPRALGIQRRRKVKDPLTGETRWEVVKIAENSWLGRNHLYVQYGLFVLGLGLRILLVNSDRIALGCFLIATIVCAITIGYLYAGKSWCHYFCPMAPVQLVYTGPRSLLGSQPHKHPKSTVTQSMCRTAAPQVSQTAKAKNPSVNDQSACVSCKAACFDIDAEKTYWAELQKPGRRLVQYGYLGMVIAFYLYYFLYAGNWDYYFTGAWTHEADQVKNILDIGFYLYGQPIPIPKAIAVFITFAVLMSITMAIGLILEQLCRKMVRWKGRRLSAEQAQHIVFTLFTATSFWVFFSYGARPSLNRLPPFLLLAFNALIVLVGSIWLYRTIKRTRSNHERENMAVSLRKQLQKLPVDDALLEGRSLDDLTPDEIYTLVKVLQKVSQRMRLSTYKGVILDLLEQRTVDGSRSFEFCKKLRQDLQLSDADHFATLEEIATTNPQALVAVHPQSTRLQQDGATIAKTIAKRAKRAKRAVN